ncbi:MAG TPA: cytochrome C oxidase subunit IV family protein [Ramlibacter sp.]|jgi:cytochrome c oxidase subunit 4|nr:cytochrome C oxidase subunit IV family protein [Ramlibacter sp.]
MTRVLVAWVALIVLMLTSLASSYLPLGPWNLVAGLVIAAIKSLIVLAIFMGLRRAPALLRIAAAIGFAMLALLFSLSGVDYATRADQRAPMQQPRQLHEQGGER